METDEFLEQVTFLIKTFERPESLRTLVHSIQKYYRGAKVIILDDGEDQLEEMYVDGLDITVIYDGYDIGLSKGRNMLVAACKTPYCIMLDDDYEMINSTVWRDALIELEHQGLDLLAVTLWNTTKNKEDAICQDVRIVGDSIIQTKVEFNGFAAADMVNNCFIANVEILRHSGWDNVFKIAGEHTDFAITSYNQTIECGLIRLEGVLHHQDGSPKYKKHRNRSHASLLLSKYGCTKLVQANGKVLNIKPGVDYLEHCKKYGYTPYSRSA